MTNRFKKISDWILIQMKSRVTFYTEKIINVYTILFLCSILVFFCVQYNFIFVFNSRLLCSVEYLSDTTSCEVINYLEKHSVEVFY